LRSKPLSERKEILKKLFGKFDFKMMKLSEVDVAKTKADVEKSVKKFSKRPASEGAMLKASDSKYEFETTQAWLKIKNVVELKVKVKERIPVKGSPSTFNYKIQYIDDGKLVDMGKTFNTKIKASKDDIITISVSEVIPEIKDNKVSVSVVAPRVSNVDEGRKEPDSLETIIERGWKANILQTNPDLTKELKRLKIIKQEKQRVGDLEFKEGDEGEGVLQVHERGLTEDQIKFTTLFGLKPLELTDKEVKTLNTIKKADWKNLDKKDSDQLKKIFKGIKIDDLDSEQRKAFAKVDPISIHSDIRFQRLKPEKDDFWMGGEGFTPGNQYKENLFLTISGDPEKNFKERILGNFKVGRADADEELSVKGPLIWLTTGDKKPETFEPGKPGATSNAFGRMKIFDKFKWRAGKQDKKFKEFEFDGKVLKGRWIFTLTPLDIGRMWLIGRPKDQELKSDKGEVKKFTKEIKIAKVDKKKRMIYGMVYEPDVLDAHNEFSTEEDIEMGCNEFMENILLNGFSGLNFMHKDSLSKDDAIIIQNWTQKEDGQIGEQIAKKGSWWIGVKVLNDSLLDLIIEGKITGFSMEGSASA